jgi:hypothetical protein
VNILDMLKDQLGGQIAGQLGGLVGEPEEKTKGAMDGMLGSILGGILGKSSTSEGAEELSKQLDDHDGGLLDSIGDIFGGGDKQEEVAQSGGGILGSLLGDKLGGIGDLLSGSSGMKSGSVLKMLGMLAPLVMGFLGKMKKSQGLDAGGFASMLMSQKDNIGAAMPDGMSDALGLKQGLFAQATGAVGDAANAAKGAAGAAVGAAGDAAGAVTGAAGAAAGAVGDAAAEGVQAGGNLLKMLLPLIVVGVLGYMGYNYIFSGTEADESNTIQQKPAGGVQPTMMGGTGSDGGGQSQQASFALPDMDDLPELKETGGKFTQLFDGAFNALDGVTDAETAKSAATKLEEITNQMDGLNEGFTSLPEKARTVLLANITDQVLPALTKVIDRVKELPGVADILQPAIDALMAKINSFSA